MAMRCPMCGAAVAAKATRCEQCQVALDWRGADGAPQAFHPFIRPGDVLLYWDPSRGPLPGRDVLADRYKDGTVFEPTPHGMLVTVPPGRAFEVFEPRLRCRDACVRAAFTTVDPEVSVACVGRVSQIEDAKLKYVIEADGTRQRFRLERGWSSPQVAQFEPLVPWRGCPWLAPAGRTNVVELRTQGPTIEARINDQHAVTVHDPVLGIGAAGVRVSALETARGPQRVVIHWIELREVAA